MRHVKRDKVPVPDALREGDKGEKERAAAVEHYLEQRRLFDELIDDEAQAAFKVAPFDKFKAYKDASIKAALEKLFHGKCAYCESRYASIHPVDIEHWRPKGRVDEEDDAGEKTSKKFGYYWLAADWENLFPSCIDCNRQRRHKNLDDKLISLGKANWFPLEKNDDRAGEAGEESLEKPLLLNPCSDKPVEFLKFRAEGVIKPVDGLDELGKKRVAASIRFYALNRTELVLDRLLRIRIIQQKIFVITELAKLLQTFPDGQTKNLIEDLLVHECKQLKTYKEPDQPFSEMSRQFIDGFFEEFRG